MQPRWWRAARECRRGVLTTATLRDATGWDTLVRDLGLPRLVRCGLRHTALTLMADAGVDLHRLQRVAGHRYPAVTAVYLHPDTRAVLAAGSAFLRWWSPIGPEEGSHDTRTRALPPTTKKGPDLPKQIRTPHGRADRI